VQVPCGREARDVLGAEGHVAAEDRVERLVGAAQPSGERRGGEACGHAGEERHRRAGTSGVCRATESLHQLSGHGQKQHHRRPQRSEAGGHLAERVETSRDQEEVNEPGAERCTGQHEAHLGQRRTQRA